LVKLFLLMRNTNARYHVSQNQVAFREKSIKLALRVDVFHAKLTLFGLKIFLT
jgi:hypothetical protein